MQPYISPFRNLGLDLTAELDKNALNLAKKRLLAELDLSRTGTILRGSVEMTKNDVLQLFDSLGSVENVDFHRQIANNRGLLAFLEKQQLETKSPFVDDLAFAPAAFKNFVHPYLAHSCTEYLITCFKHAQSANLKVFPLDLLNQLPPNDADAVWQRIETFLKQQRAQAENLTERIRRRDKVKINETQAFRSPQFVACLNWLPDRFQDLRTGYVAALFYLSEACWNIKAHKVAVNILQYAEHINCVAQNKTVVQARLHIYETTLDQAVRSAEQERAFRYVFGAIAVIIVTFFIFSLRPSPKKVEEKKVDRTFVFKEDMIVADTIPRNDSIPLVAQDFQKILHNPSLVAKDKSFKSKFLIVRIDAIKKDSTNKARVGATRQFILTFIKDFDRTAAEEGPLSKKRN
jgi:hypothetical protein